MAGSDNAPPLTCQLCSDPIDTEADDHIEATCSSANCIGGGAHIECAVEYQLKLVNPGTKGGQKKKKMVQQRPHQEIRGSLCWCAHDTDHHCDGKIVDAEWIKANAQVLKKVKKLADLAPAPVTKPKPRKKGSAHPQPQTRGPASGGVEAVGRRHDIEIKPLAARDNRLGTSGGNKVAGKAADSNKAKNLTMCPYMQTSVGQCPILHKCAFAHSEEEIAKNEQHAREKTQLQRVLKASKKHAQRNGALSQDAFEGLPEGALELAESHYSVSMDSAAWDHPQDGSTNFAPARTFVDDDAAGGWTTVGASGTVIPATNGHSPGNGNGIDHGSIASASSGAPSFLTSRTPSLPLQPAAPLLGPAATRELIRWKLNMCTSRLTNLGVTWAVAEAAAKATGANDNAAGDLIFSGTKQATWGEREVDISNEVVQALSLMEPPVGASRQRVEQAIVSARGNIEDAKQELHSQAGAASQPLPGLAPSPPPVASPRPAHPVSPPPPHHSQRPLSRASSTAASEQSSTTAAGGPPAAFNEDEWAPKWEDETPAAPAAAPASQPQQASPTPAPLPQQPPPPPSQQAPLQQLQLPAVEPKPAAAQDTVLGPITPERQPPLVATTASPAAAGDDAPTNGTSSAFTFGDFPPQSQQLQPLSPPATPLASDMSALALGTTLQQDSRQQEAAAMAPAPAQQPEEFDDLLDLLMA